MFGEPSTEEKDFICTRNETEMDIHEVELREN